MHRLEMLLKIHFALLALLGGLVLGLNEQSGGLPAIAIISALGGFVLVDWLKLFALPPFIGYIAMGGIAIYCIGSFIPLSPTSNRQLLAVAELLVLVQAVLLVQAKSRRTFEQIGIFCLLEIVVAAVFNDALTFAILLVPIAILGMSAAVLLQAYSLASPQDTPFLGTSIVLGKKNKQEAEWGSCHSPSSIRNWARTGVRMPRPMIATLGPAIFIIGLVFFYTIPRTTENEGMALGSTPQVGFSDSVSLEQVGQLQTNRSIVMRVGLTNAEDGQPYHLLGPLYLRGRIVNMYDFGGRSGRWTSSPVPLLLANRRLPREYWPNRRTDDLFFDRVNVQIHQQPQTTATAFSIPPYYAIDSAKQVRHTVGRWLLDRANFELESSRSRITYRFGTHAYRKGQSSRILRAYAPGEEETIVQRPRFQREQWLLRTDLQIDPNRVPSVVQAADDHVATLPESKKNPFDIATSLSNYISHGAGLRYTLDLTMPHDVNVDPIEEFFVRNKAGHCQYFASTLALMLRRQGIPSRLVIGYKTNEFNPYASHYVVRQSHAHVWVEALIDDSDIPETELTFGQPASGPAWVRLDPTPGNEMTPQGRLTHAANFFSGVYENWIMDMDGNRQKEMGLGDGGEGESNPMMLTFRGIIFRIQRFASGNLHGGALAAGKWFSIPAAIGGIAITIGLLLMLRLRFPGWFHWRRRSVSKANETARAQLPFYAETVQQLARLGLQREGTMTPQELVRRTDQQIGSEKENLLPPLQFLTDLYYAIRFGKQNPSAAQSDTVRDSLHQIERSIDNLTNQSNSDLQS